MTAHQPLGRFLMETGYIDAAQLASALAYQQQWGGRLGEALVTLRILPEPVLLDGLARMHRVPYVEIGERVVPGEVVRLVPERIIRARKVFPLALIADRAQVALMVATGTPHDLEALGEIEFSAGRAVRPVLAADRDIARAIDRHLGARPTDC